ncbi:MAG: ATP-binding protein [Saprospiraceae bacterium]|jgi:signal transduction histidine kinase/class 3 adenylate cyclase/ActR/RegA family two-component response regulator|nr:ATP-binding protein [Saprospiraceae bacterium]
MHVATKSPIPVKPPKVSDFPPIATPKWVNYTNLSMGNFAIAHKMLFLVARCGCAHRLFKFEKFQFTTFEHAHFIIRKPLIMVKCKVIKRMILLILCLYSAPLFSNQVPFVVSEEKDVYDLVSHIYVWKDHSKNAKISDIISPAFQSNFQPYAPPLPDRLGVYWGKLMIKNDLPVPQILDDWYMRSGEGSFIEVYFVNELGRLIDVKKTGELVPGSKKEQGVRKKSNSERILFTHLENETLTLFIRLQKVNAHRPQFHPFELYPKDPFRSDEHLKRKSQYDLFFGFMITMIVFSFLLYFATFDIPFLYYFLFLLGCSIFSLSEFGMLRDVEVFLEDPFWRYPFLHLALTIMDLGFLYFIRTFLELPRILPMWDNILKWLIIFRVIIFLSLLAMYLPTLNEVIPDQITVYYIGIEYLCITALMVILSIKKEKPAYLLLIATCLVVFGVFTNGISILFLTGLKNTITQLSLVAINFCFALGLAFRMRKMFKEKLEGAYLLNQRLTQLDKLKDQFLANTSHELRTPLHGIIGLSESLKDGIAGHLPAKAIENLNMIIFSGKRLAALVNDILDFSKLKTHEIELKLDPINLDSIVDVVIKLSEPLVKGKNIQLQNEIPKDLSLILADENRLQQILLNLVGNSIKFTEQGSIKITAKEQANWMEVSIIDTGVGISKGKLLHIFESFEQADATTQRTYGGAGLGLTISRQLVELHGGQISVQSEENIGSTFSFTVPLATGNAVVIPSEKIVSQRTNTIENINLQTSKPFEQVSSTESNFHILIVDDDPVNQQVLSNYLSLDGFLLTQVMNGKDALAAVESKKKFDLVLLDVMMPGMSGYEVCKEIRETYLPSELPVLMITAKNQVTDLVEAFDIQANDYLVKPISKWELLARLKIHLNLLHINQSYSRFVPKEFFKVLGKGNILDVKLGDQVEEDITVFFSDIRSYTTLSESMTVTENFKFLNAYLKRIVPIINSNEGMVHQFLGDGIMALFLGKTEDAINAAIANQRLMHEYNLKRSKRGRIPIALGIGLHTGSLMLGIIGNENRMSTGVVSDTVNTASRIEGLTKHFGVSILLSEDSFDRLERPDSFDYRFIGIVQVKGKKNALGVYEFFGGDKESIIELKTKTKKDFDTGLQQYFNKNFKEALFYFSSVIKLNPKDSVAQLYQKRASEYLANGVEEDWIGIEVMMQK